MCNFISALSKFISAIEFLILLVMIAAEIGQYF